MNRLYIAMFVAGALLMAGQVRATVVNPYGSDGQGTGLQTKLNPMVTAPVGDTWNPGTQSGADYINGTVQNGQSALDVLWNLAGAGSSATIVLEIAGNAGANRFGFYDSSAPGTKAELFTGGASAGSKIYVQFSGTQLQSSSTGNSGTFVNVPGGNFGSSTFGMYLQGPTQTFYSDSSLNPGGGDNLVAYQGFGDTTTGRKLNVSGLGNQAWDANSYVLGWEDLSISGSDKDYNDMILLVSQVIPVPEPATMIAGALLLLPFGASTLRILRKRAA